MVAPPELAELEQLVQEHGRRITLLEKPQDIKELMHQKAPASPHRGQPSLVLPGSAIPPTRPEKRQCISSLPVDEREVGSAPPATASPLFGPLARQTSRPPVMPELQLGGNPEDADPFGNMWLGSKVDALKMFDQDLLNDIYSKPYKKVRNKAALGGAWVCALLSLPFNSFGTIGISIACLIGAIIGALIGIIFDLRRARSKLKESELEKKRLKSLVRWSMERLEDETLEETVRHLEMVVLEFKPMADIAAGSKNARQLLRLLDTWAAKKKVMRQLWAYMESVLVRFSETTQQDFLRSMMVLQTLQVMYRTRSRKLNLQEANFLHEMDLLLQNESVKYVMTHQQFQSLQEANQVMQSMVYADVAAEDLQRAVSVEPRSPKNRSSAGGTGLNEDSDDVMVDICGYSSGAQEEKYVVKMSLADAGLLKACEEEAALQEDDSQECLPPVPAKRLKAPFFKSWEDFNEFDLTYRHKVPITQSDFDLLLEKSEQGFDGWDLCIDRKDVKVAKTVGTDAGGGCLFMRAWATLPGVDMHVAFNMFHKTANRMQWDKAFSSMVLLDGDCQGSDILYSVLRFPAFTPRDYVQFRRTKVLEDGSILIAMRSAVHPDLPEKAGHIRAESFISGYIFRQEIEEGEIVLKMFLMTSTDVKGMIPKWIINFVAPRKPGEWMQDLKKACLDYQAANKGYKKKLQEGMDAFMVENPFDYEGEVGQPPLEEAPEDVPRLQGTLAEASI